MLGYAAGVGQSVELFLVVEADLSRMRATGALCSFAEKLVKKKSILENNYQQRCSRQCIILFFQMIFDKTRLHVHVNFIFRRLQPFVTAFIRMEAPALECLPRGFEGLPIFLLT